MNSIFDNVNIYIIPPLLSLIFGVTIAVISITKGKLKQENILFAMLCIWWTLLSPVFICHHIFRGNEELLLTIERRVHFFYVYLPPLALLFFYKMTGTKIKYVLPLTFMISFFLSLSTFTDYYFYGFYVYQWGYIAKGRVAFQLLELMGSVLVVYLTIFFVKKIRTEKNQIMRMKLKYILLSFILNGLLTMTNIPALNGIDMYPLSNMMFVPLAFLAYGVLSYRLMDIRSVLHVTFMWAIISSLIVIPNALLFIVLYDFISRMNRGPLFALAAVWFYANYLYLSKIQPLIDQLFNKRKYDLHKIEASFIDNISRLKSVDDLIGQFIDVIKKSLSFKRAELVVCHPGLLRIVKGGFRKGEMEQAISEWFVETNHLVDRDLVESNAGYGEVREKLMELFTRFDAQYLVPIIHMGRLDGLLALPEKQNLGQLKRYEVIFINNIRSAFSIAMENAVMYSDLNMLKDNLEQIVKERTSELTAARDLLLQDIELARKTQAALLPQKLPSIDCASIYYKYVPMMGVSGDFIDIYVPGRDSQHGNRENAVCLFICDVSGHGVSAALTAAMVKMSLMSWEMNTDNPARMLMNMSDSLRGKTGGNFITAIACYINLETGKVVYSNAGHPPMIIIRSNGSIEFVNTKGRLISDYIPANCEDLELVLHDNDMIILYTDGILEESCGQEFYGEERFVEILKSSFCKPVDELCSAVYDSLVEFKGNVMLDDDFTILAMRYTAKR